MTLLKERKNIMKKIPTFDSENMFVILLSEKCFQIYRGVIFFLYKLDLLSKYSNIRFKMIFNCIKIKFGNL